MRESRTSGSVRGDRGNPVPYRDNEIALPNRPPSRRGQGGFFRDREIYPGARGDGGLATAECREPASSDQLPVHRSESPTGYSSAGRSPAEPASASPVTDDSSSIPIRRGNQMRRSTLLQGCRPGSATCLSKPTYASIPDVACPRLAFGCDRARRVRRQRQCHLYSARRVTFLSCADNHPGPDGVGNRAIDVIVY